MSIELLVRLPSSGIRKGQVNNAARIDSWFPGFLISIPARLCYEQWKLDNEH